MSILKKVRMKKGSNPSTSALEFEVTPVTLFVGPNNSGKSLALTEILSYCSGGPNYESSCKIVRDLEATRLVDNEAESLIEKFIVPTEQALYGDYIMYGNYSQAQASRSEVKFSLVGDTSYENFRRYYLGQLTLWLGGGNRTNLIDPSAMGDLRSRPATPFQKLFKDKKKRAEVRRILFEAFGRYFVIDPSNQGQLRALLAEREPISDVEEQGLNDAALQYYSSGHLLTKMSDGTKAFSGLITHLIGSEPGIFLVDEPEAFLYPPLAFKLGKEMAQSMAINGGHLFASTHSASFVMGCIQSGVPVNVVRLTYRDGVSTARLLDNDTIVHLMRNPLLRSTGVLNALFYEHVVITEGDTDRAFYDEINERLEKYKDSRAIPNCLFLNAQNKQTVRTLIKPLRKLGIPTAAIVDIDVIKEGGTVWSSFLDSAFVPEIDRQGLATKRKLIFDALVATGKNMKTDGGFDILAGSENEAGNNLANELSRYGLFMLRNGEIESWLTDLGIKSHGTNWLIPIFEKMGEDPNSSSYVAPKNGDVWDFIGEIRSWLTSPIPCGVPF
jgi:predicted ATPase